MGYQEEKELSEQGALEMLADYDKLEILQKQYRALPNSPQRAEVIREFIAAADRLEEPAEQLIGRYDLAWTYVFGDDPAKAMPVCAEFMQMQKENQGATGEGEGAAVVSIAMLASSLARRLPQIPLEQCESLLMEFRRQVRAYGLGERLWQCHAGEFSLMTGDLPALEDHLNRFRTAPRDDVSDCEVCEAGAMGEFLIALGRKDEAIDIAADLLEKGKFCDQQPWKLLSILTDHALVRHDLDDAERFATAMLIQPVDSPADLRCAGTLLRMEAAFGAGQDGITLLEKCLPWTVNLWDQEMLFYFYVGAGLFCDALGNRQSQVKLSLPDAFPLCQEGGAYDCRALSEWFRGQAEDIAQKFDRRNGNSNYKASLESTWAGDFCQR